MRREKEEDSYGSRRRRRWRSKKMGREKVMGEMRREKEGGKSIYAQSQSVLGKLTS